jgi:hypothetical protein
MLAVQIRITQLADKELIGWANITRLQPSIHRINLRNNIIFARRS